MEKQEFLNLLSENNITPGGLADPYSNSYGKEMPLPEDYEAVIGKIETAAHWGGEGEGESYGYVWYFPKFGYYLRADGYYYSYAYDDHGMNSATFYFVEPVQVTKTEYHAIKN